MLIADAEVLKKQLTDKYVVVQDEIPELKRFVGLTGRVKTVNMNGRALVEFDGPVDIGWYDIDPTCLKVVDKPLPKKKAAEKPAEKSSGKAAAPAPKKSGGISPLEMARKQGAAGAAKATSGSGTEKKLSPLELARQQGAAGKSSPAAAKSDKGGAKLSPLELARQQGAAKSADDAAEPAASTTTEPAESVQADEPAVETSTASKANMAETPSSTAEIIALCRKQGAFSG